MKHLVRTFYVSCIISLPMTMSQCCFAPQKVALTGGYKLPSAPSLSGTESSGHSSVSGNPGDSSSGPSVSVSNGQFTVAITFSSKEDISVCKAQKALNDQFWKLYYDARDGKITREQYDAAVKRLKEDGVETMKQIGSVTEVTETSATGVTTTTNQGPSGRAVKLTGLQAAARVQKAIADQNARLQQ